MKENDIDNILDEIITCELKISNLKKNKENYNDRIIDLKEMKKNIKNSYQNNKIIIIIVSCGLLLLVNNGIPLYMCITGSILTATIGCLGLAKPIYKKNMKELYDEMETCNNSISIIENTLIDSEERLVDLKEVIKDEVFIEPINNNKYNSRTSIRKKTLKKNNY